jgi:hypothetical protein
MEDNTRINTLPEVKKDVYSKLATFRKQYANIQLSPEEISSLQEFMEARSLGVNASVAMICTDDECPFKATCWFYQHGKAPKGETCPIEAEMIAYHTQAFIREFNVNPDNHSELMLIQELVELLIYDTRLSQILASPGQSDLASAKPIFSALGDLEYEYDEHWALKMKERIKNRRMKILEALNATRKEKWKVERDIMKMKSSNDESDAGGYSQVVNKLTRLIKEVKKAEKAKIQEVFFEEIKEGESK